MKRLYLFFLLAASISGMAGVHATTLGAKNSNGISNLYKASAKNFRAPVNQVITFPAIAAVTYGTADFTPTASSNNNNIAITFASNNAAVATIVSGKIHIVGQGTATITASQTGDANFNAATPVPQTLTVNKAALTITANSLSKTYGAANPTLTVTYSGFVNNETSAVVTTAPTVTTTAVTASAVGTFPITATGAVAANYSITYVAGVLTVNKAALTITANNLSKTYAAANPTLTVTYTGFVNGDNNTKLTTQPTITTTAVAASPAGTYPITAAGAVSANYNLTYVAGTLTVNKANLVITPDNQTKVYGSANALPAFTVSYAGFVNGDTFNSLTTPPTSTTTATTSSVVGTYPITTAGAVGANYNISYVAGTLTVVQAPRVLKFSTLPLKTYGDADFDPAASIDNGDPVTYTSLDPTIAQIVNGKIHILTAGNVNIVANPGSNSNFIDLQVQGQQLIINKAAQTISFASIPAQQIKTGSLSLSPTSSSGLPITLTSADPTIATVNGQTVSFVHLGTAQIIASQPGDINYLPAPNVAQPVKINNNDDNILVHSSLSPNGDGLNDYLFIEGIKDYPDNKITVVTQNGSKVFEAAGYNNGSIVFDGHATTNGSLLPAGSYFYFLQYHVGTDTRTKKGFIVLKY